MLHISGSFPLQFPHSMHITTNRYREKLKTVYRFDRNEDLPYFTKCINARPNYEVLQPLTTLLDVSHAYPRRLPRLLEYFLPLLNPARSRAWKDCVSQLLSDMVAMSTVVEWRNTNLMIDWLIWFSHEQGQPPKLMDQHHILFCE